MYDHRTQVVMECECDEEMCFVYFGENPYFLAWYRPFCQHIHYGVFYCWWQGIERKGHEIQLKF